MCLANFAYRDPKWLYDGYEVARECMIEWQKTRQNINNIIEHDFNVLSQATTAKGGKLSFWQDFLVKTPKGNMPPLLQLYLANKISIESMVLLDRQFGFTFDWNVSLSDDPLVKSVVNRLTKYAPFCNIKWNPVFQQQFEECVTQNEQF